MFIILDTNIWLSELGLNSKKGSAFRLFVKESGATVVVPEVIRLETERNLNLELNAYINNLSRNHRNLLTIFGELPSMELPNNKAIEDKVASIFTDCRLDILEIPFTVEVNKRAFLRVLDKVPPSDKNQQFKDCCIWEECIKLLDENDVYLVTKDKAFYKNRVYKNGLDDYLITETKNKNHSIHIFDSLVDLLPKIKTEINIDDKKLLDQYWERRGQYIDTLLESNSFAILGDPKISVDLFITENPDKLYSEYKMSFQCEDLSSDRRPNALLEMEGNGIYLIREEQFTDLRSNGEAFFYKTLDGDEKVIQNAVAYIDNVVIGHRTVTHSVKLNISDL